jgi:hypothetical protein
MTKFGGGDRNRPFKITTLPLGSFAEALVKMIGLRFHYFTVPWNVFDFLLVLASILGILMEDVMIDFPVSPTLLRVVRVFRIGRKLSVRFAIISSNINGAVISHLI